MKKMITWLLTFLLAFIMTVPAAADVLWEPMNSSDYDYEKATTIAKIYYVPEGMTVNLYDSPKSGKLLETMEAGQRVYVGFSQEFSGTLWGVGYPLGGEAEEGWFRLGRLQKEYSHDEFVEDFGDSFTEDAPVFTREDIDATVYTWTYPGSGLGDGTISPEALEGGYNDGKLDFRYMYTDPEGGRWGYVGYFMGRCGWVWLDDPTNPEPPYHAYPKEESTVTDTSEEETTPGSFRDILPVLIMAAAVVVITDLMAKGMKKKTIK